ncbi:dTDP-glucose 4,6-dehydratase [Nocardia sp. CNY236]|uniref:dTDP-glucose 4,6-dehydratase n=1 Tax=Nocardia sp. CNY236 TaxID=1169152 RepID=UPI00040C856C|nr:dTDP-glucose 4,6-dehydratase [Nocardia sp. CNY236]
MRILVTGGAGFIGSRYVQRLLAADVNVTVLDKLTYAGNRANVPAHHERLAFVRGDVCDPRTVAEVVTDCDAIVHFAAESHVDRSVGSGEAFARTNAVGTQVVLEAAVAAGVQKVVHVSTDEVYGSIEEGSWSEDCPLLPNSPYSASKAGSDLIARAYRHTHGLDVSTTRCSNNYGPHQHPEKMIPRFVTNLIEGHPVPLYGDGGNTREWLHVEDHCGAIDLVLHRGRAGEIYNIGGHPLSNLELTERLVRLCGYETSMIQFVADRKGHDRRYSVDDTKIRDELGWAPSVPLAEGLAGTVAWYRSNAEWWIPAKRALRAPAA